MTDAPGIFYIYFLFLLICYQYDILPTCLADFFFQRVNFLIAFVGDAGSTVIAAFALSASAAAAVLCSQRALHTVGRRTAAGGKICGII